MPRCQPPRLSSRRQLSILSQNDAIFDFNNSLPQRLSLPPLILSYAILKLKAKSVFKLTKTCKYLKYYCEVKRGRVIDALWVGPRLHYDFTYCMAVQIDDKSPMFETFITGLSIEKRLSCNLSTESDTVSRILKMCKKCTVKDLYIENQILSCEGLEKLCRNVRSFLVSNLILTDQVDEGLLTTIMGRIPKAIQIEIQNWGQGCSYTPTTAFSLSNLKHNAKIKHFEIDNVPNYFDPIDFGKFAKNNFACKCEAFLHFQPSTNRLALNMFKKAIKPYIHDPRFRSKPPSLNVSLRPPMAFAISDWTLSMKEYTQYKFHKQFRGKCKKKCVKPGGGFMKCGG